MGVRFDMVNMTLSVTEGRMEEIDSLLEVWENILRASKQEVQSLMGKLSFVATCVRPGRIFIARMLVFLRSISKPNVIKSRNCIPERLMKDVNCWRVFLIKYNGVSMMSSEEWSSPDEVFCTDACLVGTGGWCKRQYFFTEFPDFIH